MMPTLEGSWPQCHLLSPCHRPVLEASKDQTWIIHMGTLGFLGSAGLCQALRSVGGGGGGDGRLCHKRAALSFSQRSLLKVTVTQGRFSQFQCLDTLCLKGKEGRRAKRKKEMDLFCISYILLVLNYSVARLSSERDM